MAIKPEIIESLLHSMDIIAERQLHNVSYDKTIICTIIDNSKAEKQSVYTVTDGSVKFNAYVLDTSVKYKINDQVYVKVPNGDFSKQKIIEGFYITDKDILPVTYVSPLDSFLDMATLTQAGISEGLIANSTNEIAIWSVDLTKGETSDLQLNGVYDTIGLQASFKCLLNAYNMRAGSYGLRLDMYVRLNPTSSRRIIKSVYLDSSEMFGNPYSFTIFSPQAQTYDISTLGIIDGMTLYFYQNNDFEYFDGKIQKRLPIELTSNIFVKDVYVAFGSEVSKVNDDTIKLYTQDTMTFRYTEPNDANNSKTLGFLWYNKTDEGKYIGFSNGLVDLNGNNIIPYDELEYLNESAQETRLIEQMGKEVPKDKNGLEVSADWADADKVLDKIESTLKGDLKSALISFHQRINGVLVGGNNMDTYFKGASGKITKVEQLLETIENAHEELDNYFKEAFVAAATLQKCQQNGTTPSAKTVSNKNIYSNKIKNTLTNLIKDFYSLINGTEREFLFKDLKESIEATFPSFQNAYDIWSNKINIIFNTLEKQYSELNELLNGREARITSATGAGSYQYKLGTQIQTYIERDLSNYDNKYCVYWYRYDSKYIDDEGILGNEWRRIKPNEKVNNYAENTFTMPYNLGLPNDYTVVENKNYLTAKPKSGEGMFQVYLNPEKKEEKFKVVLFYNHQMFVSNELVFTNPDDVPDYTSIDSADAIYIEHEDYSQDSYQTLYSSSNTLTNLRDSKTVRGLSVHYDGLLGGDELLAGAQVFWYVPRNATMLTVDADDLKKKGFSTDYYRTAKVLKNCSSYQGPSTNYTKVSDYSANTILTAIYDQASGYYSLKSTNSIGIRGEWIQAGNIEIIEDKDIYMDGHACFYKQIESVEQDMVDENGNVVKDENGNIVKINMPKEEDLNFYYKIKEYYTPTALKNTIFCIVKYGDDYVFETSKTFLFGQVGVCGTDYTVAIYPSGSRSSIIKKEDLLLNIKAFNYNNIEIPIINTTTNLTDGSIYNPRLSWKTGNNLGGIVADALNDDSSEQVINNARLYSNIDTNVYGGILQLKVNLYDTSYGGVRELTTYYPVATSDKEYYIEGPTTVVYNSNGNEPVYYKDPYRIFNVNTNQELIGATWKIKHYLNNKNKEFHWENDKLVTSFTDQASLDQVAFYQNYVPKLSNDNTLTPSAMFITDENGNDLPFYSVVECSYGGKTIWCQPLVIYQNRYPNSMLNHWDGKFKIDEENGTILSTMVGAGVKNTDNTFSGVLMGNVADVDNTDNQSGLGVYGFHHGAQSFGLNVDGTAFFGKSGRGRILIDGNSGTISSASYQQNRNGNTSTAGMMIDLDDGFIDMRGTKYTAGTTNQYEPDGSSSRIHIDVRSPYFYIDSNNGNRLINISNVNNVYNSTKPNDGLYIRSDNYSSTDGMLIDLVNGHIDAYNFKLTGGHLYLNSNPSTNDYFFKIGDDTTNGKLTFSQNGELIINTNRLTLTGILGATNIIRNTEGRIYERDNEGKVIYHSGTTNPNLKYWEETNGNTVVLTQKSETGKNYLLDIYNSSGTQGIKQKVDISANTDYSISWYSKGNVKFSVVGLNSSGAEVAELFTLTSESANTTWKYNYATFKFTNSYSSYIVKFTSANQSWRLYHPMLEEGTISTTWAANPEDHNEYAKDFAIEYTDGEIDNYDIALNQEKVFDKLITDENGNKMVGIWIVPGNETLTGANELYINATYIASGILRSSNFDGEVGYDTSTKKYTVTDGTKGMYINLNDGYVWAKKFTLESGSTSGNHLFISSEGKAGGSYYFRVGNGTDYISFNNSGNIDISASNFMLSTDNIYISDTSKTFAINGTNRSVVLRMGSNFGVTSGGTLYANNANITGDINVTSGSIEIGDNFKVDINGNLTAKSANITGGSIKIGDNFNVSSSGVTIKGTLTAGANSKIGNWEIKNGNLQSSNGSVVLNGTNGNISGSNISGSSISGSTINIDDYDFTIAGYKAYVSSGMGLVQSVKSSSSASGTSSIAYAWIGTTASNKMKVNSDGYVTDEAGNLIGYTTAYINIVTETPRLIRLSNTNTTTTSLE